MQKTCKICGLPNWTFGARGLNNVDVNNVCDVCNQSNTPPELDYDYNKKSFEQILIKKDIQKKYDCIVLFTGGKDSCYTLYLLKEIYKLKVLALTWDNGFFSEQHRKNIENVTKNLNVDHKYVTIDWNILKQIYRNRIQYYGRFCNCIPLALLFLSPTILEIEAPMVFLSVSTGQIINLVQKKLGKQSESDNYNELFKEELLERAISPISNLANEQFEVLCVDLLVGDYSEDALKLIKEYLESLKELRNREDILGITPACIFKWDGDVIVNTIKSLGWSYDLEGSSYGHTSCLAEEVKAYLSYKQEQINMDILEFSYLLRTGLINHEQYLLELERYGYGDKEPDYLNEFLERLGFTNDELHSILDTKPGTRQNLPAINKETTKYLGMENNNALTERLQNIIDTRILI